MTTLGKITVIAGICIFTGSTLAWIGTGEWQWFAGGGAIFLGTLLSGAVISAETKPSPTRTPSPVPLKPNELQPPSVSHPDPDPDKPYTYTYSATDRPPNTADTIPDWTPPSTPPPDDPDPFSRPSLVPPPSN
jgi:hypothetical protein